MRQKRRDLLATGAATLAAPVAAGCMGDGRDGQTEDGGDDGTGNDGDGDGGDAAVGRAVAAEWNAMRGRLHDAVALGVAGDADAGAAVAGDVFARFEQAGGETGAHEMLESTSEEHYEGFEEALGALRQDGLSAGDLERTEEEAGMANDALAAAQEALVGATGARTLALQLYGLRAIDAAMLAGADRYEAAAAVAQNAFAGFEQADVHDPFERASGEDYEAFEAALEGIVDAAQSEDAEGVREEANAAYEAAVAGSYAVGDDDAAAGAGHIATLQARGWDAATVAGLGGPSTDVAHAAALTVYRARVHDAAMLAERGASDAAKAMAQEVFAHFEGAKAHDALEEADGEAYEGFERALSDLTEAAESGDAQGAADAAATVDEHLVAGIDALAGGSAPVLQAAFLRARLADARERYRLGDGDGAKAVAQSVFARFEEDELGVHESLEDTSEDLYHGFEEDHLTALIDAYGNGDDDAVATHDDGARSALLEYATMAGSTATASAAEGSYVASRGFDAAAVAALGERGRAKAIAEGVFAHFEGDPAGYHEALEEADAETYEAFEEALGGVTSAADGDGDVAAAARAFDAEAVASIYAVVGAAGGSHGDAAGSLLQDAFAHFENARVHEALEEADTEAYEGFEAALQGLITAVDEGGDVGGAAEAYATASLRAQFAVAGAVDAAPVDASGGGGHGEEETELTGGPNVVEGVPDDAEHVVDMEAVAFVPEDLTVSQGDTVAWTYAGGEAHSVTAYEDELPEGASYWASGGFDSQDAAETGWEEGKGAVQSGQSYVHTFETTGTHGYYCIPHEAAGMVGSVTVE